MALYFDGASRGNPGKSSYGCILYDNDMREIAKKNEYLGIETNNYAEYMGLLNGVQCAIDNNILSLEVYGDSLLVISQLKGTYKVKNKKLKTIYDKIKELETKFIYIEYNHIYRNKNKIADALANEILDNMN